MKLASYRITSINGKIAHRTFKNVISRVRQASSGGTELASMIAIGQVNREHLFLALCRR
jgi:hypothetical protein